MQGWSITFSLPVAAAAAAPMFREYRSVTCVHDTTTRCEIKIKTTWEIDTQATHARLSDVKFENVEKEQEEAGREALERPPRDEGEAEQGAEGEGQSLRAALHAREAQGRQQVRVRLVPLNKKAAEYRFNLQFWDYITKFYFMIHMSAWFCFGSCK